MLSTMDIEKIEEVIRAQVIAFNNGEDISKFCTENGATVWRAVLEEIKSYLPGVNSLKEFLEIIIKEKELNINLEELITIKDIFVQEVNRKDNVAIVLVEAYDVTSFIRDIKVTTFTQYVVKKINERWLIHAKIGT